MKPTVEQIRIARDAAGFTNQQAADRLGYSLAGWEKKTSDSKNSSRSLSRGEYELLLLLGNIHPEYKLVKK